MKHLYLIFVLVMAANATSSMFLSKRDSTQGDYPFKINSQNAEENAAPYIVSISMSSIAYAHSCTGIIINKEWVLTTAYCVETLQIRTGNTHKASVVAGLTNRNSSDKAQIRTINFSFGHKEFNNGTFMNDIGLIHVTPPFQFNIYVKTVVLPLEKEDFTNKAATHYGWGLINATDSLFSKNLQIAKSTILDNKKCKESLPNGAKVYKDKHVCFKISACYGDDGSPLVIEHDVDVVELIGIASWGYVPCGYNKRPTIYTAISNYIAWISQVQWAYSILH